MASSRKRERSQEHEVQEGKTQTSTFYTGGLKHLLKDERKAAGLTLKQLSKKSGVAYMTLWRFEHGHYGSVSTLAKITEAMGIGVPHINFLANAKPRRAKGK